MTLPAAPPAALPRALPSALPTALIIAGPTCSGKSALALHVAQRLDGVVINADSMQVYRELRVVTARPTVAEEAAVPHALYGVRAAGDAGSVAWWRAAALAAMQDAKAAGRMPILCGGTGLYLASLVQGIAPIPEIDPAARDEARGLLATGGAAALHARLAGVDPATAAGLRPGDGQRVARAWEVWRGTGRGLAAWQALPGEQPAWQFRMVLLDPPRPDLRVAIAARFGAMIRQGAVDEVRALLALGLDPALPAMRAHGVPELAAFIRGDISLPEAERRAVLASSQYTKRQATWFRHRSPVSGEALHMIHARFAGPKQFSERERRDIEGFVIRRA